MSLLELLLHTTQSHMDKVHVVHTAWLHLSYIYGYTVSLPTNDLYSYTKSSEIH